MLQLRWPEREGERERKRERERERGREKEREREKRETERDAPAKAVPQRGSVLYITVLSEAERYFMAKFSPYAVNAVVTMPEGGRRGDREKR